MKVSEHEFEDLGLDSDVLVRFCESQGPLAVVDLETTGLADDPEAQILEFGVVLVDSDCARVRTASCLVKPAHALPRAVARLTGLSDNDLQDALSLRDAAPSIFEMLKGRVLVAHNADFEKHFLSRQVSSELSSASYLDTLDLLAVTHPDAADLRLESFTRMLFDKEERHRALDDAVDTARVMSFAGAGARQGTARFVVARRALERFAPESPWLSLLGDETLSSPVSKSSPFITVGTSKEDPVAFESDAIAAALADEKRGKRHFPRYRVREEQIKLARHFVRNLQDDEILLIEGGAGIGKSLAYLAPLITFAMERERSGDRRPVVVSTRTKLLQDQLLEKDIGAVARFLGHDGLRAVSIKGRANYACERRLAQTLSEGSELRIFERERLAYAVLASRARIRGDGEIGTLPGALVRRYPALRDLQRRSVSSRAEQCSREQCASERDCSFGRRRAALANAHLLIANHDLLLRWPPDYPTFEHVIVDEVHELADVVDDVYAVEVGPELLSEVLDDIFGRPMPPGRVGRSLLPSSIRRELDLDSRAWRRELRGDFRALGAALVFAASEFGEVDLPESLGHEFKPVTQLARQCGDRLNQIVHSVKARLSNEEESRLTRALATLTKAVEAFYVAFSEERPDAVVQFEGVEEPFDRWKLILRPVSPADAFENGFLRSLRSFAGVSASIFVKGDAMASLGDLEIEARAGERLARASLPSPFDYERQMRVAVLRERNELVEETTSVLELLAMELGGRTLGLFTSLHRMRQVSDELTLRLRKEGIDVLSPRRASDDPSALVTRFVKGAAVLLGARKFWQGLDIPGDILQAVVIEKLPFEVPSELRRRRELLLENRGMSAFNRYTLGKMLLNLKQMVGRLIRTETDCGLVVIVDGRPEKSYFHRLEEALPPGVDLRLCRKDELLTLLKEVGIGRR